MADPITAAIGGITALAGAAPSWLPWAAAAGSAGLAAGSMLSSSGTAAPPQVNIPAAPGVAPAQVPGQKPAKKSQQQAFMSGAAMAQQTGSGTSTGKTLLGA